MDSKNERFTQVLLYAALISGIGMLVLGFTMPGSVYIDVCGVICAVSAFFLISDPEILGIDGRLKFFRFVALAWAIYSAYKVYTKM